MTAKTRDQLIPLALTLLTFLLLVLLLHAFLVLLNLFPSQEKILLEIRPLDVLVGLTIYIKTAIDFAIFIGNLMYKNPGWKNRISIELGTALGNACGTLLILLIWNFFREIPLLMVVMIFIASLVLLKMAEESLREFSENKTHLPAFLMTQLRIAHSLLRIPNTFFSPILGFIIPRSGLINTKQFSWKRLLLFSMTVPFILGLDDFAGYIPLFSVVKVYGFAIGVFFGHMLLNIALFLSPARTVRLVRHPFILLLGGIAFVAIAAWGFYEVVHILLSLR